MYLILLNLKKSIAIRRYYTFICFYNKNVIKKILLNILFVNKTCT